MKHTRVKPHRARSSFTRLRNSGRSSCSNPELRCNQGVLRGDVLIHCGDGLNGFSRSAGALDRLDEWFGRQEFNRIFCTGGNHDFELEYRVSAKCPAFHNAEYLQDESREYGGISFYGVCYINVLGWSCELLALD